MGNDKDAVFNFYNLILPKRKEISESTAENTNHYYGYR